MVTCLFCSYREITPELSKFEQLSGNIEADISMATPGRVKAPVSRRRGVVRRSQVVVIDWNP